MQKDFPFASGMGAVILAAGSSSRMGRCKQLLRIGEETLVEAIVRKVAAAGYAPVVVVIGAYAEQLSPVLAPLGVEAVFNPDWAAGMGGSIAVGVGRLRSVAPACTGALVTLSDQPLLTTALLRTLHELAAPAPDAISACRYGGFPGPPAVFGREWFDTLCQLSGPAGARKLLREQRHLVRCVPFEDGALDLDTPEAWQAFLDRKE